MPTAMPPPTSKQDKSQLHKLALKGSSKTIVEFFDFACNTILFQRGVYPPEDFTTCVANPSYFLNATPDREPVPETTYF